MLKNMQNPKVIISVLIDCMMLAEKKKVNLRLTIEMIIDIIIWELSEGELFYV